MIGNRLLNPAAGSPLSIRVRYSTENLVGPNRVEGSNWSNALQEDGAIASYNAFIMASRDKGPSLASLATTKSQCWHFRMADEYFRVYISDNQFKLYADGTNDGIHFAMANSQATMQKVKTTSLELSGATETWTNAIPAGSQVLGVTARVTTLVEGATSMDIGDGTDADIFIDGMGVALNTIADLANCNDGTLLPNTYKATTDIVVTALGNGASFTAGVLRLTLHYIELTPPSS